MSSRAGRVLAVALVVGTVAAATAPAAEREDDGAAVAAELVRSLGTEPLRVLIDEVLERNPALAVARARASAAALRAPQVRALPEPLAGLTLFVEPPETRTGPQRAMLALTQPLPWPGKRALREEVARWHAAALVAEVEADRLELVTETRRLAYELGFLERYREISEELKAHLVQHEEIARGRYSTGVGLGQSVVKLQAEITRVDRQLLDIESRAVELRSRLNRLRDRSAGAALARLPLPAGRDLPSWLDLELESVVATALALRPEMVGAAARVAAARAELRLAEKGVRPDFRVGVTYTLVEKRDDAAGRLAPPADNGDDVLGIQGGITLPVRRRKLAARTAEATELERAALAAQREASAAIESDIADLAQRVPLAYRQLRLLEDLLLVQAEEALSSAQAGYVAGTLNALDLLDAEHVLFEANIAAARARADYLIGVARLEGAVGEPLFRAIATPGGDS